MSFSPDLERAFMDTEPAPPFGLPPGWHRFRPVGVSRIDASTGTPGLKIAFRSVEPGYEKVVLHGNFWFAKGSMPITRRDLEIVGFKGLTPTQIETFRDFDKLSPVWIRVGLRDFEGRQVFDLLEYRTEEFVPPAPGPTSGSASREDQKKALPF